MKNRKKKQSPAHADRSSDEGGISAGASGSISGLSIYFPLSPPPPEGVEATFKMALLSAKLR